MHCRVDARVLDEVVRAEGDVLWANESPFLVDPQHGWYLLDVVQVCEQPCGVDQRRMRRRGSFDERACFLGIAVNSDRDYGETQGSELFVQRLPDRQILAAASPGGPAEDEHLVPAVLREAV